MTNAFDTINGRKRPRPTAPGSGRLRIATSGKIRACCKVLTKRDAGNPTVNAIDERGVATDQAANAILHATTRVLPDLPTPHAPGNVASLSMWPNAVARPEVARQTWQDFGEDILRRYRLPAVVPAGRGQTVERYQFDTSSAHEKKSRSEYGLDGQRYCTCYASVCMETGGKCAIRLSGGCKTMLREENGGTCNPESWDEFGAQKYNLPGRFIFFIPCIQSIGTFALQVNSVDARRRSIEQFETMACQRGGRISGFPGDRRTALYLTKKLRNSPPLAEAGGAVRISRWLIELESPIDIAALRRSPDVVTACMKARCMAQALVEPFKDKHAGNDLSGLHETVMNSVTVAGQNEGGGVASRSTASSHTTWVAAGSLAAAAQPGRGTPLPHQHCPSHEQVMAASSALSIGEARFEAYAARRWGPAWKSSPNDRWNALDEIERYRNDPDGLIDKIDTTLQGQATTSSTLAGLGAVDTTGTDADGS